MSSTITRDFNKKTIRKLAAKGITVYGVTSYPVTYANGSTGSERAYQVNDNGTGRVMTRQELEAAA